MGVRLPLQAILDVQNNGLLGVASVNGGIANTFTVPQDSTNIVVKMIASTLGGGVSTILQTTDDGGTTWYDVARTSVVSNANATTAEWLTAGLTMPGMATAINGFPAASILTVGIGNAAASTVGQRQVTGLPFLGTLNRVFLVTAAGVSTVNSVRTIVYTNGQDNI